MKKLVLCSIPVVMLGTAVLAVVLVGTRMTSPQIVAGGNCPTEVGECRWQTCWYTVTNKDGSTTTITGKCNQVPYSCPCRRE